VEESRGIKFTNEEMVPANVFLMPNQAMISSNLANAE
jgi:hypothetical protein